MGMDNRVIGAIVAVTIIAVASLGIGIGIGVAVSPSPGKSEELREEIGGISERIQREISNDNIRDNLK